jgi:hypothetical protein
MNIINLRVEFHQTSFILRMNYDATFIKKLLDCKLLFINELS